MQGKINQVLHVAEARVEAVLIGRAQVGRGWTTQHDDFVVNKGDKLTEIAAEVVTLLHAGLVIPSLVAALLLPCFYPSCELAVFLQD